MSRFKEGDTIYVWWHTMAHNEYRKGTVVEILDDVNAMVKFDDLCMPCKCYIERAIPYRAYEIMGDKICSHTK